MLRPLEEYFLSCSSCRPVERLSISVHASFRKDQALLIVVVSFQCDSIVPKEI